ncbi:MAG: hypothetical protein JWL77_5917 [Chthonomonadaceae bacterium]|nr:hypothetical protein [Chthonomonadaceae bacterium]
MKYLCPVCGYDQMEHPPQDYAICLCCRTEFGVSDFSWTHEQLRQNWIARGAKWGSSYALPPPFWSPIRQLRNIGYQVTDAEKQQIVSAHSFEATHTA